MTIGLDGEFLNFNDADVQALAEKYAPIVYHSSDESNFPTNVDWFLERTNLWFYDDSCTPDLKRKLIERPTQQQLIAQTFSDACASTEAVLSNGTRSTRKQRTFFLEDVAPEFRGGSSDSREWTTYYHAYVNDSDGITLQYWRFYAYNDATFNHGGDWEGIYVILDQVLNPTKIGLLGHQIIDYFPSADFEWEETHPRVYSEGGGHATRKRGNGIKAKGCGGGWLAGLFCHIDPSNPATYVRQECWTNGLVHWFDGRHGQTGALLNVGQKTNPMNGQVFLQYSGIWGSPGTLFESSGYWGPAYNETGMRDDGFINAWANGMKNARHEECYPAAVSR